MISDLARSEKRVQRQESRVFARQSTRQDEADNKGKKDILLYWQLSADFHLMICFLGTSPSGVGQLTEVEVAERGSVGLAVYRHVANSFGF